MRIQFKVGISHLHMKSAHQERIRVEDGVNEAGVDLLPVVEEELLRGGGGRSVVALLWPGVTEDGHRLVLVLGGMIKFRHCH